MGKPFNQGSYNRIPEPYTHAVLNSGNRDSRGSVSGLVDLSQGAGGDWVHIFYKTSQIGKKENYNGKAISDIVIVEGQGAKAPNGYTLIPYDLNAGCGSDTKYLYLAYKRATESDESVIDFIRGMIMHSSNMSNLPANDDGTWEWVKKWSNGNKGGIADTNEGAKGEYVRLMFHKILRQQ